MGTRVIYILCLILYHLDPAFLLKLNHERLLLPLGTGIDANISLELSDFESVSCYEWKSSFPELLLVKPYFDEKIRCSTKAVISVLAQSERQQHVVISVLKSGEAVLFCDVIIDKIHHIDFHHESSEIYIGGPPVKVSVIAKDENGNTFSSLNGVGFQWKVNDFVESLNTQDSMVIVRALDSSRSPYVPIDIHSWKYPTLTLEGIKSGIVSITASLRQDTASYIASTQMMLSVSSNMMMRPSGDIYSLVGAYIDFSIITKYDQNIDSALYTFETDNTLIAKFENGTRLLLLNEGQTSVSAKDDYGNHFEAVVHVVRPESISLQVLNSADWSLQEAKTYDVLINLWDSSHHPIHFSENMEVYVSFPGKFFHVNSSLPNGLRHTVLALVPGSGIITAKFLGIKTDVATTTSAYDLKASQKFTIYQAIQISPSVLLLPYYDASASMFNITLKASGGTGSYSWTTSDAVATNVISETKSPSIAVLNIHKEGDFVITAKDKNPSVSAASAKVSVQHVADIEVYPSVLEAEIGSEVYLPVGVLGYECRNRKVYRNFDDCRNINIDVEIIEKYIVAYKPDSSVPSFGRGCLSMNYMCLQPGHSRINLSYKSGGEPLKTTVVIACHKPLKPIHPIRVAVFALGTKKEIAFEGGPRPWPLFPKGHFLKLIADKPQIVNITIIKDSYRYNKDLHVFTITCVAIGEVVLSLHVGNKASPTNPNPAKMESSIRAVCIEPNSVHLAYKNKEKKKLTHSESGREIVKVPFYGKKLFEIDLWVKDEIGRKFSNISTLNVHWTVSDDSIAKPIQQIGVLEHVDGSGSFRKLSRNFQEFQMTGKAGPLKIEAQLTGYKKEMLQARGISDIEDFSTIVTAIELELVSLRDLYNEEDVDNMLKEGNCHGDTCKS